MRAGRLRHVITIQAPPDHTVTDEFGEPSSEWTVFATAARAGVEPLTGKEVQRFQQDHTETPIRVIMRYIPGVTAGMRVVFDGRYFEITAPPHNPNFKNRELILMCVERSYD